MIIAVIIKTADIKEDTLDCSSTTLGLKVAVVVA
jgi:hypothetical protein